MNHRTLCFFTRLLLAGCLVGGKAHAQPSLPAGLKLEGTRLIWQGELRPEQAEQAARLIRQGNATALELRNSPGAGKFATTIFDTVFKVLRARPLPTYARGVCGSACASIFLLGKEPTMLKSLTPGVPTVLMFHAMRYQGAVDPELTRTRVADIAAVRGERARHLLLKVAEEGLPLNAALYIFPKPVNAQAGSSTVLFCDGRPGQKIEGCAPVPGDALRDLGVVNGL